MNVQDGVLHILYEIHRHVNVDTHDVVGDHDGMNNSDDGGDGIYDIYPNTNDMYNNDEHTTNRGNIPSNKENANNTIV